MEVTDLTGPEQVVLVGLVRHLVLLDGEITDSELYDLIRLGVKIGRQDFSEALAATEDVYKDRSVVLERAREVGRDEARAKISAEVERIAAGDGIHPTETAFMVELQAVWS